MNDITKQPYSKWLEESLKVISEFKPACLCIAATSPRQMGGEGGLGGKVGCGGIRGGDHPVEAGGDGP